MAGIAELLGGVSPNSPEPTIPPEILKRRRDALAAALAKSGQIQNGYTNFMQPVAQGVNAVVNSYLDNQAAQQQAAGAAAAASAFGSADRTTQGLPRPSAGAFGLSGPTAIQASASSAGAASAPAPVRTSTFDAKSVPSMLATAGQPYGISPDYLTKSAYIESRFDPNASNASGAKGMFQFVPSTARQYGLTNPYDPVASADAAARLAADNKATLSARLGRDPSDAELYLAHQQGAVGAAKLIGNPSARAGDIVGDRAIRSNGGDPNAPASSFTNLWTTKFNNTGAKTASADPQADLPAPGARNAALDPNQGETGFVIPPAPQPSAAPSPAPAPYNDEFPGAMIQMAPQVNGGDMVPLPPSRPADLGGGGGAGDVSPQALAAALSNGPISAPSPANDATVAALAPPNQPAPNAALIQALDPSALGQNDTTDAAATFSPQLMGPPQQFDPGPSASPMAVTVNPSAPSPQQVAQAPLPPPRPQDIAQAAPPMPAPRPTDLAEADPRADMPAPGAQEAALTLQPQSPVPPQGAGWAQLPGPALMVSNPLGGINPNSNDAGAGAFARDPANRGAAPVQMASNGPTVLIPAVTAGGPPAAVQGAPGAPAGTQVAQAQPGAPTDIRPQAQGGAPASNAPVPSAAPDLSSARQQWMGVLSHPFATKVQQDYARDQLKALDERGSFTQWKDDTGATWQRDQRTGQTSVVHDGTKYQTFKGADDNTYAWNPENPTSAPVPLGPKAGIRPLVDQQERAAVGVPKDYKGVVQVRPDGGIEFPGKASTEVNIDQKAETSEAQGRGAGLAKRLNDVADDGTKANEDALLYQRFGDILNSVKTGKSTETLEKIRQATGLTLDPNTDNVQALNSLIQYIGPRLRVAGSGSQSDRELSNFLQSIPSLAGTPGGNQKILDTLNGAVQFRKDRADIASQWQTGEISAKDAIARMNAMPSPYAPKQQDAGSGGTPTAPGGNPPPAASAAPDRAAVEQELRRRGLLK